MKISLIRRQYTAFGGGEKFLVDLYRAMKNIGVEVEIKQFNQPKWLPSWIKFPYYDIQACHEKKGRFYYSLDRLSCLEIFNAGGGTHRGFLKTKGFTLNPLHLVHLWMEKRAFERSSHIIAVSKLVKKEILSYYSVPPEKISVIYNGIKISQYDDNKYSHYKKKLFQKYKISKEAKIILFVGSGFKRKGAEEFLSILSRLSIPYHAFLIGKEKNISHYLHLANRLGIDRKVTFVGPHPNPEEFYYISDLFLFPTHYEPFGNVILEAMNFKNLVITTRQCGAGELLDDTFIMENPEDENIYKLIEEYLRDEEKLNHIKESNYQRCQKFSIENNAIETIKIAERIKRK